MKTKTTLAIIGIILIAIGIISYSVFTINEICVDRVPHAVQEFKDKTGIILSESIWEFENFAYWSCMGLNNQAIDNKIEEVIERQKRWNEQNPIDMTVHHEDIEG